MYIYTDKRQAHTLTHTQKKERKREKKKKPFTAGPIKEDKSVPEEGGREEEGTEGRDGGARERDFATSNNSEIDLGIIIPRRKEERKKGRKEERKKGRRKRQ